MLNQITLIFSLMTIFIASPVYAHHDEIVGDGLEHELFHALLWGVAIAGVFVAVRWYKRNKNNGG
ncbi:hypothetical protein [Alteromonas sp. a30]|uniref:hypothetical protein n=1 Tax=Alteromonas sp. a30 TaxID=2730917 RepID=UPI0022821D43|nr:hypothetical protein [Alteromonas sp. a30]MCY7294930.1 hypothetical protein [Alteromonas sp. a30]